MFGIPAVVKVVPVARTAVWQRQNKDTFLAGQISKVYKIVLACSETLFLTSK